MPCDTVSTVSVTWSQTNTDLQLLTAALTALYNSDKNAFACYANAQIAGQSVRFRGGVFQDGQFDFRSTYYDRLTDTAATEQVAKVKRAYGAEIVKSQAKKFGWQLKETAPYQFEVLKR